MFLTKRVLGLCWRGWNAGLTGIPSAAGFSPSAVDSAGVDVEAAGVGTGGLGAAVGAGVAGLPRSAEALPLMTPLREFEPAGDSRPLATPLAGLGGTLVSAGLTVTDDEALGGPVAVLTGGFAGIAEVFGCVGGADEGKGFLGIT
jgi:hypothetical protein